MVIEFDERAVTFGFGELDEIVLAYATTIYSGLQSSAAGIAIIGVACPH